MVLVRTGISGLLWVYRRWAWRFTCAGSWAAGPPSCCSRRHRRNARLVLFDMTILFDDDAPKKQKQIPLQVCPACGSTWFRKSGIERYSTAGDLISCVHMEVLMCLCGAPLIPERGGMPESATVARELSAFFQTLDQAAAYLDACHNSEAVTALAAANVTRSEKLEKVTEEVSRLERLAGCWRAPMNGNRPGDGIGGCRRASQQPSAKIYWCGTRWCSPCRSEASIFGKPGGS